MVKQQKQNNYIRELYAFSSYFYFFTRNDNYIDVLCVYYVYMYNFLMAYVTFNLIGKS